MKPALLKFRWFECSLLHTALTVPAAFLKLNSSVDLSRVVSCSWLECTGAAPHFLREVITRAQSRPEESRPRHHHHRRQQQHQRHQLGCLHNLERNQIQNLLPRQYISNTSGWLSAISNLFAAWYQNNAESEYISILRYISLQRGRFISSNILRYLTLGLARRGNVARLGKARLGANSMWQNLLNLHFLHLAAPPPIETGPV